MKKILLPLLLVVCSLMLQAQNGRRIFYPGTLFGSFNIGGTIYTHGSSATVGAPYQGLSGGCWVSEPLAFQLAFDIMKTTSSTGNNYMFLCASAEFKWDLNYTLFDISHTSPEKVVPVYPMVGLGVISCTDMKVHPKEHGFHAMVGVQASYQLSKSLDAKLEYKCFVLPQYFNGSKSVSMLHNIGLGLLLHQNIDQNFRRTESKSRDAEKDWFVGIGIGANYSAFDILTNSNGGGEAMLGFAPEVMFGRDFSRYWSLRIQLIGFSAHERYNPTLQVAGKGYYFSQLHADVMVNLTNLIIFKRNLHFNVMPYLGAGPIWRYDKFYLDYAADFGLFFRYYVNHVSDVYLDMRYVLVKPAFGGGAGPSGHFYGVGLPSITVGYIYFFERNPRYFKPRYECPD